MQTIGYYRRYMYVVLNFPFLFRSGRTSCRSPVCMYVILIDSDTLKHPFGGPSRFSILFSFSIMFKPSRNPDHEVVGAPLTWAICSQLAVIVLLLISAPCSRKARNSQPTQFIVLQRRHENNINSLESDKQRAGTNIQSEDNSGSVSQLSRI